MTDLEALFPGFASRTLSTGAGRSFCMVGGSGPPLALLHGFPETLAMWSRIAPALTDRFTVVAIDLRGYGWSSVPASRGGAGYTKRAMGEDVVAVMEALGFVQFACVGHDRGARVGYRLALDHPGRLSRLVVIDIVPTFAVWREIEAGTGAAPHWPWLARPEPEPETKIGRDPDATFLGLMRRWARGGALDRFDPRCLALYRDAWGNANRIHAMCEDYRAGAGPDRAADEADLAAGRTIACPVHILASTDYLVGSSRKSPLDVWRESFAPSATGQTITSGHFIPEEAPEATLAALERAL